MLLLNRLTVVLAWIASSAYCVLANSNDNLNTDCDLSNKAIENDLQDDQDASVPKVCFSVDGGVERCFYLMVPDCARDNPSAVSLIVDFHDRGSCPLIQSQTSGWREFALSDCFVVAWPLGTTDSSIADEPCFTVPGGISTVNSFGMSLGSPPDCCCTKGGKLIPYTATNDLAFIKTLISKAMDEAKDRNVAINSTSVHLTGYGNGATAALGYAALYSSEVACVSSFSGTMVTSFPSDYTPLPLFTVLDSGASYADQELPPDATVPTGTQNYFMPSASRTDAFFASVNNCGNSTSKSNEAVDQETSISGIVVGGKFEDCDAPVNFLIPPFAAYKARSATESWPVNRVVDTTLLAMYFCKDKVSPESAYHNDVAVQSSAANSFQTTTAGIQSLLVMTMLAVFAAY
jgi:poly(3-hydroxybutyrate) depolymerase